MFENLISYLESTGVDFVIHDHVPIRTVQDALEKWPRVVDSLVKTIAFRHRSGAIYLVAVHAQSRIDYAKLARVLGHKRRDLSSLSPQEVGEYLGVEPGGVFPLPILGDVSKILFDERVLTFGHCFCGTGRLDKTLEIQVDALIKLADGVVADVVKAA